MVILFIWVESVQTTVLMELSEDDIHLLSTLVVDFIALAISPIPTPIDVLDLVSITLYAWLK